MENGRVCSNQFGVDTQLIDREVVGECMGCKEDILEGDETLSHPEGMLHDDINCIVQYIKDISFIGIATKEK